MINECTSAYKKIGNRRLVVKNRDKHYMPNITVHHELRDGTEILYYIDEDSRGIDGINEYGIGVAFNSVNFKSDHAEKQSKNAESVLRALSKKNIKDTVRELISSSDSFKGLMIVSSPEITMLVENNPDLKDKPAVKKLDGKDWNVFTNMPEMLDWKKISNPKLDGENYLSCVIRKAVAEVGLHGADDIDSALESLAYRYFSDDSHLNPSRDSEYSVTHMQVGMDFSEKQMFLSKVPGKISTFKIEKSLPSGYEPKCALVLRDFKEPTLAPFRLFTTNIEEAVEKFNLVNYLVDDGSQKDPEVLTKTHKDKLDSMSSMELAQAAADSLWEKERLLISIIRNLKKDPVFFTAGHDSGQVEKEIKTLENMLAKIGDDYSKLLDVIHTERYGEPIEMLESRLLRNYIHVSLREATVKEADNRKPRKKGQKKGSSKHSDLYTDEDPKGTIHGLGFKDAATAKKGVAKVNKARRKHAHKVQATLVMKQRAKVAKERTKDPEKKKNLNAAYKIWSAHLEKLKAKTKKMNESL